MATLYSTTVTAGNPPRWSLGETKTVTGQYNLSAALAVNDVVQMVPVPKGALIQGITLGTTDLDTNNSPAVTLSIGDGNSTARFVSASTIGQTGGVISNNATVTPTASAGTVATGLGYKYTVDDTIDIFVAAGPGTGATTGSLILTVTYYCGEYTNP